MTNLVDESVGFIAGGISRDTRENRQSGLFTVCLTSETDGQVVPSTLTFTPANWNANQTVMVTGLDDDMADGNQDFIIGLTIDALGTTDTTGYASLDPPDVSVTNLDDETAGTWYLDNGTVCDRFGQSSYQADEQ